jgi:TfoX/Sxy family transcriptional regulator of competence genes
MAKLRRSTKTMKPTRQATPDDGLVQRVRQALSQVSGVKEKRMFGSVAFMVRGKMCVTARAERIMCRIDPALHDEALGRPGARTVVMGGRRYRGYVYVAAEALTSKRELKYWINLALDHNKTQAKNA